jgi:tetratricopeptide (TPR) repeat protein
VIKRWQRILKWNLGLATSISLMFTAVYAQDAWERDHEDGVKAARAAHFADAEKLLSQSADEARKDGAVNPLLARSLLDLGEVYRSEGKYSEAQSCYDQALQIYTSA